MVKFYMGSLKKCMLSKPVEKPHKSSENLAEFVGRKFEVDVEQSSAKFFNDKYYG